MSIVADRPFTLAGLRKPRTKARQAPQSAQPRTGRDEAALQEAYEMLAEAAHLVARAGRELRAAGDRELGVEVAGQADLIHDQIRKLPSASRRRPSRRDELAERRFAREHC